MSENAAINVQPTRAEAEDLLGRMIMELSLMQGSKKYLENRVARQQDFLGRVTVESKPERRARILKRLDAAQQELRSIVAEITTFEDRIEQLRHDLAST